MNQGLGDTKYGHAALALMYLKGLVMSHRRQGPQGIALLFWHGTVIVSPEPIVAMEGSQMRVAHSQGCIRYFKRATYKHRAFRHHKIPADLLILGSVVVLCGDIFHIKSRFDRSVLPKNICLVQNAACAAIWGREGGYFVNPSVGLDSAAPGLPIDAVKDLCGSS